MVKKTVTLAVLAGMLSASPALAMMTDPIIEGAKLCTRHLPRYEREYAIPTHLLAAIASTESGRYHKGLGIAIPWPWTINAEGKGYYYNSKAEAVDAAKRMRARGVKSMDVGCMQVNLMYHPHAFSSLEEAFEPQHNIAYSASFLRTLYEESKSWKTAAASYHSKTPSRGTQYVGNVYDRWLNIVSKLREARLHAPAANSFAQASGEPASSAPAAPAAKIAQPKPAVLKVQERKVAELPEQRGSKTVAFKPPRMNSIKVTRQEEKRENGIIVVRPEIKVVDAAPVVTAASPSQGASPDIVTIARIEPVSEAKVIHIDGSGGQKPASATAGPRFIFDN